MKETKIKYFRDLLKNCCARVSPLSACQVPLLKKKQQKFVKKLFKGETNFISCPTHSNRKEKGKNGSTFFFKFKNYRPKGSELFPSSYVKEIQIFIY